MSGLGAMSGFLEPGQQALEAPVAGENCPASDNSMDRTSIGSPDPNSG